MSFGIERLLNKRKRSQKSDNVQYTAELAQNAGWDYGQYSWLDSGLEKGSSKHAIGETFFDVIPFVDGKRSIRTYIENTLKEKAGRARGIEFGGVGARMFRGFTEGFFAKTAGVTLIDERPEIDQVTQTQSSHTVFEMNMFDPDVETVLDEYFDGKKVDLIIERLGKGVEYTPSDPYVIAKLLSKWYEMLNVGGIMFLQVPVTFRHLLADWADIVRAAGIEIEIMNPRTNYVEDQQRFVPVLRLRKLPESPDTLPLLTPREVRDVYKEEGRL